MSKTQPETEFEFVNPEMPGENLTVVVGDEKLSFLGPNVHETITAKTGGAVYVEDWR